MKSWKKKLLAIGVVVVLIILAIVGVVWSRRGQVTVQTGKVGRQDLTAVVTASGQIEPENYANVNANSIGKITNIYVKEGDQVKKGELLLRIQDVEEQADVDAQEAALKASQATLASNESSVESFAAAINTAKADLVQAQAQLAQKKLAYQRGLQLLKDSLLAKQDFDQRFSDYKVAQATVQSSKAKLTQAQAQYNQAKNTRDMASAQVAQNRATLMRATDVRNQTIYRSPYNGVVTSLPVHVGENVVPGVQNQTGSLLFQVSDLSVIDANVMVDETDIANIKLGQKAYVSIDALPNKTFQGDVTEIGQSALSSTTGQTTTAQTQTSTTTEEAKQFKVVVRLENPPKILRPGLSTTARVITATSKNAVSVPIQALTLRSKKELEPKNKKGGQNNKVLAAETQPMEASDAPGLPNSHQDEIQGVFVIDNGHVKFVPVKTGIMGAMNAEVLSGLKPGETIVTGSYSALRTLRNGDKIRINNTPPGPNGPGPST
ncbi:MAG TPA: HlyD family efflux transporter periplasmic adaptor subunit [Terriglobia bacterium]|nr:HlyD family efflux transporter periplasmic adaptor subunit [Terriglobia bacterium]